MSTGKDQLTLDSIQQIYRLCSAADCSSEVPVTELAKELSVKKTLLMSFILENDKCFLVKNSPKGLLVTNVFLSPDRNPCTEEWLNRTKQEWKRKLYVSQWNCHGYLEEYYLPEEFSCSEYEHKQPNNERNTFLWRNTEEKLKSLGEKRHYHQGIGSTGMCMWSDEKLPYAVSISEMENLIADGWLLEGTLPDQIKEKLKKIHEDSIDY